MKKSHGSKEFKIHIDGSCMTDSTDLQMPPERVASNETVVHHDSWSEASLKKLADENEEEREKELEKDERERQIDRIEAQIQAAARAVVASIEKDAYGGGQQDSELSMRTDDSYEGTHDSELSTRTDDSYGGEETELSYDGTESSYLDGSEMALSSEGGDHPEVHNGKDDCTEVSYDTQEKQYPVQTNAEDTEKESIETEIAETQPDSETKPPANTGSQVEGEDKLEDPNENVHAACDLDDGNPSEFEEPHEDSIVKHELDSDHHSENDQGGDSSSHHEGDIDDDDVFSRGSRRSARSSLNSSDSLHTSDDTYQQKELTSPAVGEEASSSHEDDIISRIPSTSSYMRPIPDHDRTPSKVHARPPFRTPSSVRAMQMSSPTASMFSSPRSSKRHLPAVSRNGTPSSMTSKNRTPTRFKPKKEYPLVLLHVTVLPLQWPYSHLMSSPELPESLQGVRESWSLLQQKLAEAVYERGILLPHPQDSYETLEERLHEALELPIRPRAVILKCGHYMGPQDIETSSDEEGGDSWRCENQARRKWCDICRREVRIEHIGEEQGKKFTIKTYASNGLMRAGAWAAVWREMERVDVEIEPFIETAQRFELEKFATIKKHEVCTEEEQHGDGFVDEEDVQEEVHDQQTEHELENEARSVHAETIVPEEHIDAEQQRIMDEAELKKILEEEELSKFREEERMREFYRQPNPPFMEEQEQSRSSRRSSSRASVDDDSLPELLLAAFKVAMRDKKNIVIVVLSLLVLIQALRSKAVVNESQILGSSSAPEVLAHSVKQSTSIEQEPHSVAGTVTGMPSKVAEIVTEISSKVAEAVIEASEQAKEEVPEIPVIVMDDTAFEQEHKAQTGNPAPPESNEASVKEEALAVETRMDTPSEPIEEALDKHQAEQGHDNEAAKDLPVVKQEL